MNFESQPETYSKYILRFFQTDFWDQSRASQSLDDQTGQFSPIYNHSKVALSHEAQWTNARIYNIIFRFSWYLKKGMKHVPVQCETQKNFLLVTNLTKKRNIRCCFKKLILTRLDLNSKEVKITSSCVSRQQLPNI